MRGSAPSRLLACYALAVLAITALFPVHADTEIINFHRADPFPLLLTGDEAGLQLQGAGIPTTNTPTLTSGQAVKSLVTFEKETQGEGRDGTSRHTDWYRLQLPRKSVWRYEVGRWIKLKWGTPDTFTLRVSWPASHPAKFKLDIQKHASTRALYARVDVSEGAVRAAEVAGAESESSGHGLEADEDAFSSSSSSAAARMVPYVIEFDTLWFSVIPETAIPMLLYVAIILFVLVLAGVPAKIYHSLTSGDGGADGSGKPAARPVRGNAFVKLPRADKKGKVKQL